MELAVFHWLLSPAGQHGLALAATLALDERSPLADLERLRREFGPERAAALAETIQLRRRAVVKFERAERLYFTREALEQASGEAVAAHTARRLATFDRVADLGCGIGGDTLALARQSMVVAIDRDRLRLAMARANLAAYDLAERVRWLCADVTAQPPPPVEALFVDPARRVAGRRRFDPAAYQPSLAVVQGWARAVPAIGVKVAPGIEDAAIPPGWEIEFIALAGELKAAVLWHGPLRTATRRASLLPAGLSLSADGPPASLPLAAPSGYLYEPDPAVIRAHVIDQVAALLAGWQIDPTIAYLCAERPMVTPLARCYPIDAWFPFSLKRLQEQLRQRQVGQIVIKKRGSPLEPVTVERRLKLAGPHQRVVVLTRVAGQPAVILCHPPLA